MPNKESEHAIKQHYKKLKYFQQKYLKIKKHFEIKLRKSYLILKLYTQNCIITEIAKINRQIHIRRLNIFKTPIIPKLIKRFSLISVKTLEGFSQKKEYKSRF